MPLAGQLGGPASRGLKLRRPPETTSAKIEDLGHACSRARAPASYECSTRGASATMATMAIRKRWLVWLTLVASTRCGLAMEDDAVEDNLSSKSSSWEKSKKNASQIEK
eukprot:1251525-Pyramimonas_sp.AAC.1